jgi:hypothetical protein
MMADDYAMAFVMVTSFPTTVVSAWRGQVTK